MSTLPQTVAQLHEAYSAGEYNTAEMGIQKALKRYPQHSHLLQLGVLTALAINQVILAHQRLDMAVDRVPMTAELANIKGRVHQASGDWAAAETAYNLSQKLDPKFARARINRLNLFCVSEQPKRVLDELQTEFDFGEGGEVARSQALTDLGRYNEALEVLDKLRSTSFASQVMFQKIKCFSILGHLDEMMVAYEGLPCLSPMRAKALRMVVNSFEMRGHKDRSLQIIEQDIQSESTLLALQSIKLLRRIGQDESANIRLEVLSNQRPDNKDILSELAYVARVDKQFDKSCQLYTRALTAKPGDFLMLCGFAQSAISAGRFADAQTALQAALAQSPNNQFLLALVATLLREMGQDHTHLYDYKNFVRIYELSPPEGYSDIASFNAALANRLEELHVYSHEPVNQTLRSGSQTEMDLSLIDDPVLNSFFEALEAPIKDYMKALGWDAAHPLRRRNTNDYRISGAWSVRLAENGHHVNHVHPMGWISSAYYVAVPPSVTEKSREGWIEFGKPDLNVGQKAEYFVQPEPGRLVLFPSYMWHGTIPFTGSETRLTLPFDVVPA